MAQSEQCEIFEVLSNIYLSPVSASATQLHTICLTQAVHFVEVGASQVDNVGKILHISAVHRFCDMICTTIEEHPNKAIIVCPEIDDRISVEHVCFLVGAYLILRRDQSLRMVQALFESERSERPTRSSCRDVLRNEIEILRSQIEDGWKALSRAKQFAWFDLADESEQRLEVSDIELSLHYADQANGNIHTIVPHKLLFFHPPLILPDGQSWIDLTVPGGSVERRFSPAYLADLLVELDASVVACLGECSADVAAAFEEQGLDVHDLKLDPRRPSLLRAMDQLLTVARAAPGAVAVFCDDTGGSGHVGTLAVAYLMSDFGFDAVAADAWVRMTCPSLCASCGAYNMAGMAADAEEKKDSSC